MTNFKRLSVLFVVLCLALCLVFVVSCSKDNGDTNTNTNTNTNTDTNTDTATDSNTDTSADATPTGYAIYVVDANGNPVADACITWCDVVTELDCKVSFTDATGYAINADMSPLYCVKSVIADGYETFTGAVPFTEDNKIVTITLTAN